MADEGRESSKLNVALVVAIVAGALTLITNTVATYLNNQGTLEVERQKEKAESELERQKARTSLILEAVKVGDKQKAIDNLTFFIDAGLLDDPDGKIRGLLKKNVPPVLPSAPSGLKDSYSFDGGPFWVLPPPRKNRADMNPDEIAKLDAAEKAAEKIGNDFIKRGDDFLAKGDAEGAFRQYRMGLQLAETHGCDTPAASSLRDKIDKLATTHDVPPCVVPLSKVIQEYFSK